MENQGYGKRPLWQWVLIYLLIGGAVYGLIYYFAFAGKDGSGLYNQNPTQNVAPTVSQPTSTPANNIYMIKTDPSKGAYLTDLKGMTLYLFDKDTKGVSNCYDACVTAWPILAATPSTTLPENVTIVNRTDGTMMYAYDGMPLYYYFKDTKPGDLLGDGVGGVWHLVKPVAAPSSIEMEVKLNEENSSGESGTAILKEENGKTTVTVSLTGFVKDVPQPAHIHVGFCPGVEAVKYPLASIVNGSSTTILNATLAEIKQNLPLAVNVHKSAQESANYTACGELSSK